MSREKQIEKFVYGTRADRLRENARFWLGVLLLLTGIGVGLYVGVWWGFVGGIVQFADACKVSPVDSDGIALGILRTCSSGIIGSLSAMSLAVPGVRLMGVNE